MNRELRRIEKKTRRRRLKLLEKIRGKNKELEEVLSQIEEDFDTPDEIEKAKVLIVDVITGSYPFSEETFIIDEVARFYELEPADVMLLLEIMDEKMPEKETKRVD